ncbi:MAG TPA: helix-turn-helix domain-containing protein [Chitinispirillaceae bacterium]|nr:helix-turn-helix domain-containing protein [Chitinispirillaceae bacterium]
MANTLKEPVNLSDPEDRWLSITEICKHLGVSNDTVYKWIEKHNMPAHRMGRLWKFKKKDVDNWVKIGGASEMSSLQKKGGK